MSRIRLDVAGAALACATMPAAGHHSFAAEYDRTKPITPTGTGTNEDRVFFTKPWYITRTFTPARTGDRVMACTCTENNPNQPNLGYKHQPTP
jgi:hypothetical protein